MMPKSSFIHVQIVAADIGLKILGGFPGLGVGEPHEYFNAKLTITANDHEQFSSSSDVESTVSIFAPK